MYLAVAFLARGGSLPPARLWNSLGAPTRLLVFFFFCRGIEACTPWGVVNSRETIGVVSRVFLVLAAGMLLGERSFVLRSARCRGREGCFGRGRSVDPPLVRGPWVQAVDRVSVLSSSRPRPVPSSLLSTACLVPCAR